MPKAKGKMKHLTDPEGVEPTHDGTCPLDQPFLTTAQPGPGRSLDDTQTESTSSAETAIFRKQTNMEQDNRLESLRLWNVMERVGVTERMRNLHRDTSISKEIMETLTNTMEGKNMYRYYFGSSVEGTATPCMHSDRDVVCCSDRLPVIHNIQQAVPGVCLLIQNDEHIKPGYVKLQYVYNGTPLTVYNCGDIIHCKNDCAGRVCRKHFTSTIASLEQNGPASTASNRPGYIDTDHVAAFRSRTFPSAAVESLLECTRSGWLPRDKVEQMMSLGCLFVGVGHPASDEKDIEWRVSFSLQERQMMFSLNPTQHACYVLMKLIKEMLTSELEGEKSITSYHCKTCVFRTIIKIGSEPWSPENLIPCTFLCLDELLQCLYNNDCPNFFIKTNNMFEQRFSAEVTERLIDYIIEMFQEGSKAFYRIQSDSIGDAFRGSVGQYVDMDLNRSIQEYNVSVNACETLVNCHADICKYLTKFSSNDTTHFLFQQICSISLNDTITEYTQQETRSAVSLLISVLHKLYAQHLASLAFSTDVPVSRHHLLQSSAQQLTLGITWDLMCGRLLYVTILYRQGNIDLCRTVLGQIEQTLNGAVESVCKCYKYRTHINDILKTHIESSNSDPQSITKEYVAACTIFLPSHSQIIPTALQYEMYRSVGTQPGSRDDDDDAWFDQVAVDSKSYIYFLEYLVYSTLNKAAHAKFAMNDLNKVLTLDENLGHRETGYNLLGWICIQEGRILEALKCFIRSWRIRPDHNAAKWHVLLLYHRLAGQQ